MRLLQCVGLHATLLFVCKEIRFSCDETQTIDTIYYVTYRSVVITGVYSVGLSSLISGLLLCVVFCLCFQPVLLVARRGASKVNGGNK